MKKSKCISEFLSLVYFYKRDKNDKSAKSTMIYISSCVAEIKVYHQTRYAVSTFSLQQTSNMKNLKIKYNWFFIICFGQKSHSSCLSTISFFRLNFRDPRRIKNDCEIESLFLILFCGIIFFNQKRPSSS